MTGPLIRDVVLRAVHAGQRRRLEDITREFIVVEAWAMDMQRLGLPGYRERYPDSNKVTVVLVDLVKLGLLYRPKPGTYAVTEKGRVRLEGLEKRAA